jgi:NADH-quinone oxidoreductase subunit J
MGVPGMDEPKAAAVPIWMPRGRWSLTPTPRRLGKLLYTEYLYPVEIAAVILLVAMIAAIALTLRQRKDTKAIDPSMQVRVRARDRLQVVKLTATQKPGPKSPASLRARRKKHDIDAGPFSVAGRHAVRPVSDRYFPEPQEPDRAC